MPARDEASDPGNVIDGDVIEDVGVLIGFGNTGRSRCAVLRDHPRLESGLDVGKCLTAPRRGDQRSGGVRSDIKAARYPFSEGAAPVCVRRLTPVDLTQQDHLRPTQLSDCRFRAQELLLDAVDGGGLDIHTSDVSRGCDRNAVSRTSNPGFFSQVGEEQSGGTWRTATRCGPRAEPGTPTRLIVGRWLPGRPLCDRTTVRPRLAHPTVVETKTRTRQSRTFREGYQGRRLGG